MYLVLVRINHNSGIWYVSSLMVGQVDNVPTFSGKVIGRSGTGTAPHGRAMDDRQLGQPQYVGVIRKRNTRPDQPNAATAAFAGFIIKPVQKYAN